MARRSSTFAEPDSTTSPFMDSYFDFVENFPDELSRLISIFREHDAQLRKTLQLFEIVTRLLRESEKIKEKREILTTKSEAMAREIQEINEEKLNCTLLINNLITSKYKEFEFNRVMLNSCELTPAKFIPEPGSSTPLEHMHKKRGRKPKDDGTMKDKRQASVSTRRDSVESSDLMMLAEVALIKKEDEEAKNVAFGKLPVTKHSRKNGKNRKGRKEKESKEDSDSDSELAEGEDNEPLYCLCNCVSYGSMVECSNEACSIEWFHFGCVGLKGKAPKGKWYCPKCRSRKSNVSKMKKEYTAN